MNPYRNRMCIHQVTFEKVIQPASVDIPRGPPKIAANILEKAIPASEYPGTPAI